MTKLTTKTFTALPAFQEHQQIPKAKRRVMFWKTVGGWALVGVGFVLPVYTPFPWQAGGVVAVAGGWLISQQGMVRLVKFVVQSIAAVVGALGGKSSD